MQAREGEKKRRIGEEKIRPGGRSWEVKAGEKEKKEAEKNSCGERGRGKGRERGEEMTPMFHLLRIMRPTKTHLTYAPVLERWRQVSEEGKWKSKWRCRRWKEEGG